MKCPVCVESDLVMSDRQGVEIDYCPKCRGVWLDRGELDKIIERSDREGPDDDDDDRRRQQQQSRPPEGYPSPYGHQPPPPPYGYGHGHDYRYKKKKSWWHEIFD